MINGRSVAINLQRPEILDNTDIIVEEMLSGTYVRQRAAVDSLYYIIVELSNHAVFEDVFFVQGIIPHFLQFLERTREDAVKLFGAVILRRVIRGYPERSLELMQHGIAATLVELLGHGNIRVTMEAIEALNAAVAHPVEFKEALLERGTLNQVSALAGHLVEVLQNLIPNAFNNVNELIREYYTFLHTALRILNFLCAIRPQPASQRVVFLIPLFRRIILGINQDHPDLSYATVCTDACFTFICIIRTLKEVNQVEELVNARLIRRLIRLMQWLYERPELVEGAHLLVRKFLWTSQATFHAFMQEGLPQALNNNLREAPEVQSIACRTIDWAIFCNPNSIQEIVFSGDTIGRLIEIINGEENGGHEQKTEAISVVCGVVRGGTDAQIEAFCTNGCIRVLCHYLNMNDTRVFCIRALQGIIQAGDRNRIEGVNVRAVSVAEHGRDIIGTLINNEEVGDIARWILENINRGS